MMLQNNRTLKKLYS